MQTWGQRLSLILVLAIILKNLRKIHPAVLEKLIPENKSGKLSGRFRKFGGGAFGQSIILVSVIMVSNLRKFHATVSHKRIPVKYSGVLSGRFRIFGGGVFSKSIK